MHTRSSVCRKQPSEQSVSEREKAHLRTISSLKREVLELKNVLDAERTRSSEALQGRVHLCTSCLTASEAGTCTPSGSFVNQDPTGTQEDKGLNKRLLYELQVCKKELEHVRGALEDVCEEREALRVRLTETVKPSAVQSTCTQESSDDPHLDWVGRHYLAVSLPDDRMFRPGVSVTPVGVLHKLFEMRVGDKQATGFSVLIENMNIMISHMEPEWYAKHFGFCTGLIHANGYRSTKRLDTEDFVWLLFEYGAHAPMIEVMAGLLTVSCSTGKGGVTATALCTSKGLYSSYVSLFRDTVTKAYEGFQRVREKALRVRKAQGVVYVPVTAGLTGAQSAEDARVGDSLKVRGAVLRSILEGIEVPQHIGSNTPHTHRASLGEDPFKLDQSLADFIKHKGSANHCKGTDKDRGFPVLRATQDEIPLKKTRIQSSCEPLVNRVLFSSPWPDP